MKIWDSFILVCLVLWVQCSFTPIFAKVLLVLRKRLQDLTGLCIGLKKRYPRLKNYILCFTQLFGIGSSIWARWDVEDEIRWKEPHFGLCFYKARHRRALVFDVDTTVAWIINTRSLAQSRESSLGGCFAFVSWQCSAVSWLLAEFLKRRWHSCWQLIVALL